MEEVVRILSALAQQNTDDIVIYSFWQINRNEILNSQAVLDI